MNVTLAYFKAPCFMCRMRFDGCHSKCVNYNMWKHENEKMKEQVHLEELKRKRSRA